MRPRSAHARSIAFAALAACAVSLAAPSSADLREPRERTLRRAPERLTTAALTRELAPRLANLSGELNNEKLWARVRADLSAALDAHWRRGALLGTKASEAFFVRCDATTMTQTDIAAGTLKVVVGFAAVKPAEFESFTLQQAVQRP